MKQIIKNVLVGLTLSTSLFPLNAAADDFVQQIENKYVSLITSYHTNQQDTLLNDLLTIEKEQMVSDQNVEELHQRYPIKKIDIDRYLALLTPDGSWKDINYKDTKRSGWEPKIHARRILNLAKYKMTQKLSDERIKVINDAIHSALNYWFTTQPVCKNWWYNQIGLPRTFGEAFVLLKNDMSASEKENAIKVMNNSQIKMTGQNKVWLAGNVLIRGILTDDKQLIATARDAIFEEITLGRNEGIKPDWSFHQHGAQQQFGNYGLSFLNSMSFYFALFQGTKMEMSEEQQQILSSFINEGYKWIIWKRNMDVNGLNRQLFHNAAIHKGYLAAIAAQNLGIKGFPTNTNPIVGHKHFINSDYTLHRSPKWMTSLKMSSSRVIGTELVNEDNLQGFYMGDGATYFYVDGDEYLNIFPLWDWRKIPGVTAFEDKVPMSKVSRKQRRNQTSFVGGITYHNKGMSAMQLKRDGLHAQKAWLFTDDFVLCLGAGISTDSTLAVTTTIDQRNQDGPLWHYKKGKWTAITEQRHDLQKTKRFFHDKTGYILLKGKHFTAQTESRKGRWHDVMGMYKNMEEDGKVMSLFITHGVTPQNETYAYMVFPAGKKETVAHFPTKEICILKNDAEAQVVNLKSEKDIFWIVNYSERLSIELNKKIYSVAQPGIYCVEKKGKTFRTLSQQLF